jgi:predicted  nucleic acid-binding Zn-ribbon protein
MLRPKVRKILEKDVQVAAHSAYSQFITLTDSMSAVIPDETVRFKAALAALRPQGFELDAVLKDIDECLYALDLKDAEAEKAAAAAETQRVGAKMKQMSELETRRAELQVELEQVLSSIEKIRVQVERDSANIRSTREKFAATVSAYKQELLERRKKIHMSAGGFGRV